ncbi:TetR family transcriptional regulator [Lysinibacillus contaminans]|uniref:TetR family transcriptional regulator n=1 Tax=Lysinibacillus contaminans TaxID=1293441 RepID=A0ABR5JWP5_9BACI|nr:TetR/AcrR family transcriptional regulator [Lysinibacillus contaminans]KOS66548.1 TetR family transcriptional regulator [Lysinibacillus contaminans]
MVDKTKGPQVQSTVKDESLIAVRREQMIQGAIKLFKEKGFHRATTREIAKAAGFSIGTLYEYIRTKEDVLYLVCDSIYKQSMGRLANFEIKEGTVDDLKSAIREYFLQVDGMLDELTIMYQETKSLSKEAQAYVFSKEFEIVAVVERLLKRCVQSGEISMTDKQIHMAANSLVVQGQSWAFRKWALHRQHTLDEYIEMQTTLFISGIKGF